MISDEKVWALLKYSKWEKSDTIPGGENSFSRHFCKGKCTKVVVDDITSILQ